jgi:molecular chaperone GrpE
MDQRRCSKEVNVAEPEQKPPNAEALEQVEGAAGVDEEPEAEHAELAGLQEELEKAKAQAAEYLDGWQRAQAEFSNYKKRQGADRAQMIARANADLLRKLLPVVDDFERAMATLPANLSRLTWCQGVSLIKHKLDAVLDSEDVELIDTEGQVFDPCYHEAVTYEEIEGYEDGQIIGEVQRGYVLGERVLRPALVRVAKAPAPQPEESVDAPECKDKE